MESIPETENPVQLGPAYHIDKSSPLRRSLNSKRSLSILSSNEITRRTVVNESSKPIKQRIISESTGLVKFSLKSTSPIEEEKEQQLPTQLRKQGLPFYIPVDSPKKLSFSDELMSPFLSPHHDKNKSVNLEEEVLFTYAKKQREVLELKSRLEQAEKELKELESQLQRTKPTTQPNAQSGEELKSTSKLLDITSPMLDFKRKLQETGNDKSTKTSPIKEVIRSQVSRLNFSHPVTTNEHPQRGLNRQQSLLKIKQDFNDISSNLITDGKKFQSDFLAKSKNFMNSFPVLNNNEFNLGLNGARPNEPLHKEDGFKSTEKDYYSDDNDMTYSSDQTEFVEDLEGGHAVPYEVI